jgi:hypothetical protein
MFYLTFPVRFLLTCVLACQGLVWWFGKEGVFSTNPLVACWGGCAPAWGPSNSCRDHGTVLTIHDLWCLVTLEWR